MYRPLADEIRPSSLEEVVGQKHILGKNGLLRRVIASGAIPNMVFYGPPGTGKTTVAGIIAQRTRRTLHHLNATTASIADIKNIISDLDTLMAPGGVLLYLDEIQYFNKKQQQSLLEFMENGKLTLIAATTENPYFYVYGAVLSRSTVFEFKPVLPEEMAPAILRAVRFAEKKRGRAAVLEDGVEELLAEACGGDVRRAVNAVELLFSAAPPGEGKIQLTLKDAALIMQRAAARYDRNGDQHYDILSAFQKSIRGSDPDAGLYYLARLLEAGDLISPCRRLLVIAAEDVGLAYPQAMSIVTACVDAARQLGLPEARLPLAQAVILLATAPKSNSTILSMDKALSDVRAGKGGEIPEHLKDAHYSGAKKLGRGETYVYPHNYKNHYVTQQYLPGALQNARYYGFGENKAESAAKAYWERVRAEADD
ncbi:MAG: replication-associated recombination protein A [Oscillospiraceae bacterium]|nr:replication-associated recombination protein A [Oscillospiraceae bacterium]